MSQIFLTSQLSLLPLFSTVAERAQYAANRKNICKLSKQLHQFDNIHVKNARNTTKETRYKYYSLFGCVVSICSAFLYMFALWAFAAPAVKLMKMFSWFAGAFSICMCFPKLHCIELFRPRTFPTFYKLIADFPLELRGPKPVILERKITQGRLNFVTSHNIPLTSPHISPMLLSRYHWPFKKI